jgi:hypothetical protein
MTTRDMQRRVSKKHKGGALCCERCYDKSLYWRRQEREDSCKLFDLGSRSSRKEFLSLTRSNKLGTPSTDLSPKPQYALNAEGCAIGHEKDKVES